MDIGEKISLFRKERKITLDELAEKSGVPKSTINKIIAGISKSPSLENVRAIASVLGKTLDDFCDTPPMRVGVTNDEMEIVKKFRTLDAYGKETVSIILDREYTRAGAAISQQKPEPAAEAQRATLTIDYYRLPVSAGTGTVDPGDGYHDTLEVLANRYTVASDYVVRVQGDSMKPRFLDGDLLLVHKTDVVDFGEIGVFSVDGKSFIKQAGCGELISLNRDYSPIPLTSAAVYPQGRIIGVLDPAWIVH